MATDIKFFESFQAQLETQLDQKRETDISSAIKSSILRLLILFDAENIKSNTEGFEEEELKEELEEDIDILKSLQDAKGFEEWIKDQLEYQSELSPEDSDLASTFFIGDSENCEYKNVERFLADLDFERASKIIKDCFEKAKDSKTNENQTLFKKIDADQFIRFSFYALEDLFKQSPELLEYRAADVVPLLYRSKQEEFIQNIKALTESDLIDINQYASTSKDAYLKRFLNDVPSIKQSLEEMDNLPRGGKQ